MKSKSKLTKLIIVCLFAVSGLVILGLPLPEQSEIGELTKNIVPVMVVSCLILVFGLVWPRVNLQKSTTPEMKSFVGSLVFQTGIMFIVQSTGGLYSYFAFLYFLPLLWSSVNLPIRFSIAVVSYTTVLFSFHLFIFFGKDNFFSALSLYTLYVFGVWLVTALGRFLVAELNIIQKRQQELQVEQLRQLDKLKDEFVFIIAHELRSPITAIRGYLELITTDKDIALTENLRSILQKSFTISSKIATIISLLLEVARIETGKIRFYLQKIDLLEEINFATNDLKQKAQQKEINLSINVPKETLVLIDKERLDEIINILVENAIEFTPRLGKIVISSQSTEKHTLLTVSDTGVGVPEDMRNKIFDKFYTEKNDKGDEKIRGYGISLYASKNLLLKMGGDISVESIVGKGTTFTVYLPKYWSFSST